MFSNFFLFLLIFSFTISFIPKNSNANIYELKCKNEKYTTNWYYSNKRRQVILIAINGSKTKVKFQMDRQTPSSFSSKGVIKGLETDVKYTKNNNQIAMLQKSLRGSNRFFTCEEPVLKKKE